MATAGDHLSLRRYGPSPGSHSHDHFQVLVGLDGVLELEVDGRGRRVGPGEALLVTPGDRHEFESLAGSQCLVLDTRTDLWSLYADAPRQAAQVGSLARYLAQALLQHHPLAALHGPELLLEAWGPSSSRCHGARPVRDAVAAGAAPGACEAVACARPAGVRSGATHRPPLAFRADRRAQAPSPLIH